MNIFKTIKESVSIEAAYQRYDGRPLKRTGNKLSGKCSMHDDKTPSFLIYQNTNSGYCFGCQWGGDVIKYTADLFGLSNLEACRKLAQDFGIQLPDTKLNMDEIQESSKREENQLLGAFLVQKINDFYNQCTNMFKFYKRAVEACKVNEIEYTDELYRRARQGLRFYDRITDEFIEGTFEKQVNLMTNFNNEVFFKLKVGGENAI